MVSEGLVLFSFSCHCEAGNLKELHPSTSLHQCKAVRLKQSSRFTRLPGHPKDHIPRELEPAGIGIIKVDEFDPVEGSNQLMLGL
jgi:hypothetical protein